MRVALILMMLLVALLPTAAAAQPTCGFALGFKAIADLIPGPVGPCLENEHFNTANGNAEQRTAADHGKGGLLVWRKADNWTAYTDGYWSWVNGPKGLQKRLNTERFDWEAPAPVAATSVPTQGAVPAENRAAIQALLDQLGAEAKQAALSQSRADARFAEIQRRIPGSGFAVDLTLPVKEMRQVPGTPNIEVRGDLVIRARLVDSQGRTLLGIDLTDVTPFVKIAVPKPDGGWAFAAGKSVLKSGACEPDDGPIKGNRADSGELIYHVPGGQFYDRTRPEMCFKTPTDAQAAGFRPSQR